MPLCIALAVREMGMTPAEAVHAATYGGAAALDRDDVGAWLAAAARADLVVLDAPSHVHLAYRPGVPLVAASGSAAGPGTLRSLRDACADAHEATPSVLAEASCLRHPTPPGSEIRHLPDVRAYLRGRISSHQTRS